EIDAEIGDRLDQQGVERVPRRQDDHAPLQDLSRLRAEVRAGLAGAALGIEMGERPAAAAYFVVQVLLAVERRARPGGVARLHVETERVLVREAPDRHRRARRAVVAGVAEMALTRPETAADSFVLRPGAQPEEDVGGVRLAL